MTKTIVGIYVYDDAEVLDFSGPFEVFSTAHRLLVSDDDDEVGFDVHLIGVSDQPETPFFVRARGGFCVQPSYSITDHPSLDVLIVPGGVHTAELQKTNVLEWLARQHATTKITASVCTGAFLLAQAEILTDQSVTTHWEDIHDLQQQFPQLAVVSGQRWVEQGKIVTSGGISAGIDMALHLVRKIYSFDLAQRTARQMEIDWTGHKE